MPDFNSVIAADHLLAIGTADGRAPILIDIEAQKNRPEIGLVADTLQ